MNNIIGKKFHHLTVIEFDRIEKRNNITQYFYKCKCDCGILKSIRKDKIGVTKSCGHLKSTRDQAGSKNPCWKGGISKDISRYRKSRRIKYIEKVRANGIINSAIRRGSLKRQNCEVCNTSDDIHAHHDDYSKPHEVRWLCRKHHREFHESLKSDSNPYGAIK